MQKEKKVRKPRIGRRGLHIDRGSFYGRCLDCGKPARLLGYICRPCYMLRDQMHKYRTDKEYRKRCIERAREWRKRKVDKMQKGFRGYNMRKFGKLSGIRRV